MRVTSGLTAPVLAAATFLVPVAVTATVVASVAAVGVVKAAPAKAQSGLSVAVVLVNGESSAPETAVLDAAGYDAVPVTPATLTGMSQATFDSYAAVVIGDSSTASSCDATAPSTAALGTNWEPWVKGNVAILGTAPARPGTSGADALIADAVQYAAAAYNSSAATGTGLYVSLNCGYSTAASGTAVSLLGSVEGIGTAGGLTVNGSLACTDTGTVNKWEADAAGTFSGLISGDLGSGSNGFPSPACPVEEAFDSWPAMFTPVAYDASSNSDATANFTASDGVTGQPYVLLGSPASVSSPTAALAPSTGGEVPAGTTAGGSGNPAAAGLSQATAADPVDTENGDFTQSDTDLSVATFGPSLDFTRTYDAQVAEQQTQAGTPGALGYGWTDDWASSLTTARSAAGDIYTLDGLQTDTNNGGVATDEPLNSPGAVATYSGDTYIADTQENRVEEIAGANETEWGISMTQGHMYTIVGSPTGEAGEAGNGSTIGPDGTALLNQPDGIAVNSTGLFISDTGNCRVLEIPASGADADEVEIYAGRNASNCTVGNDNKAATSSNLSEPEGLHFGFGSETGDLYIADTGNDRIQEVAGANETEWGQTMIAGDVYTVAGTGGTPGASSNGTAAASSLLDQPGGLVLNGNNDLFIADTDNCRVEEVPSATRTDEWGGDLGTMDADDIYTIAGRSGSCTAGNNDKEAIQSDLDYPDEVGYDATYGLYIADTDSNVIKLVADNTSTQYGQSMTNGDVYAIAGTGATGDSGDGGSALSSELDEPGGIYVSGGTVTIADTDNNEIRQTGTSSPYDITDLGGGIGSFAQEGDGGAATTAALSDPHGTAADAAGDIFIADTSNNRVQEIAASDHTQFGIAMTAGDVYTVAGQQDGQYGAGGDGGKGTSAFLSSPVSVAVSGSGNLYIDDDGNCRIQEVSAATGDISTIAGSAAGTCGDSGNGGAATSALLDDPLGVAVDAAGDVFIAGDLTNEVQEVPAATGNGMTAGDIYVVAGTGATGTSGDGGAATSALLDGPSAVAVDATGNIYICDADNNRIQEIAGSTHVQWGQSMIKGDIYTVAGNAAGTGGNGGDGGPATKATLDPSQIAVDASGDLYIADWENNRIREVAAADGTQWGQSMTAGDIYNVAGSEAGTAGESGDGGPAAAALMNQAQGIGTDAAGDLFITDASNNRVREVTATASPAFPVYPVGGNITVTQPGGAQVTFSPETSSGTCTSPLVTAGGYCVQPAFQGATLTSNTNSDTYAFVPSPGSDTYTYSWDGQLVSETDTAGNALTVTYDSPAPGSTTTGTSTAIQCPASASSCETITSASGRALVIGSSSAGLVTSATDPMNRQWTYAYNSSDQLTSATDPMGNVTSYTYGAGGNGPLQASDLLTITDPNAQPGGPDAGDATVDVYNSANQVTAQTDPMGFKTTFNYCVNAIAGDCMDAATGNGLISVTDPDGNTTVYDYDQGTLTAQSEWTETTLTSEDDYTPDTTAGGTSGGTLVDTTATNADGETTSSSYDSDGNVTSSTSPAANGAAATTTSAYTSTSQYEDCSSTAEAASTATCSQDPGPSPVGPGEVITPLSSAPPEGLTWTLYDTDGNQLYQTTGVYSPSDSYEFSRTTYQLFKGNSVTLNGTDVTCTHIPPSASLPCVTINADGVVTQLEYDAQGDLVLSATPDGNSGGQLASTSYTYDADGEQLTKVAPDGNVSGANSGNYTATTAYNADGEKTSVTEGNGSGYTDTPRTTSYTYDGDGNQTKVEDARGYTTSTTYNADNKPTLGTNPDGDSTLTCYDGDGNTVQSVPAVGVGASILAASSCPTSYPSGYTDRLAADATVSMYNALGEMTSQTTPASAGQSGYETTIYTYDGDRNLLTTTAPPATDGGPSQVTVDTYNSAGQLASQTTGYGTSAASTISYCYDPNGDKTSVIYGDGNTSGTAACSTSSPWTVTATPQANYQTTYSYDSVGELISTTTPANSVSSTPTTTATYDAAGNVLTSTDPDGVTTTWTYTPLNKVATISYSASSAHSVSYTYDAEGNQTTMTDATGTSTDVYDAFGELTSAENGVGQTVSYAYNADGKVTAMTYPLPSTATWATTDTVTYRYDAADQLTSATDFNGSQIGIANTADGLQDSMTLGSSGDTIATTYDNTDNPSAITLKNSSSTLQSFTYSDAPSGNILSETDTPSSSDSPADYAYDAQGRVTSLTPGTGTVDDYGFDASGNLTTLPTGSAGTYNPAEELTSSSVSGATSDYTYNADGEQLTSAQGSVTESSGTWNGAGELATYDNSSAYMTAATYNGNGLRMSTSITLSGASAVTERYVWNTTAPTPQIIMDGTNAYIYASGVAPTEQVNLTTGSVNYLMVDGLGSVRGIVSSSGSLSATTSYDAWGNPQTVGGLTAVTPFGFAGGYTDADGLIYMLNRYYEPSTGQFTSVDPDLSQTLAPYAYAGGDPVSNTDPTGKDDEGGWGPAGYFWANFLYTKGRYAVEFGWRLTGHRYAWFGGYIDFGATSNYDVATTGGPIFAAGDSSVVQWDIWPGYMQGRWAVDSIEAQCGGWELKWGWMWVPFYAYSVWLFGFTGH